MPGWGRFCDAAVLQNGLVLILTVLVVNVTGQCSNPPSVQNAVLSQQSQLLNDFPEGTTVTYECSPGYRRASGSPSISCSNGQWSQPTLTCDKKSCGSPGEILNGKYDLSEGIHFGATARVICNEGYQLVGRARLCLADGWSTNIPVCEVVSCPDVFIPNGKKVAGRLPPYGYKSFITFECDSGHKANGTLTITCGVNGWSSEPPTCYRATQECYLDVLLKMIKEELAKEKEKLNLERERFELDKQEYCRRFLENKSP